LTPQNPAMHTPNLRDAPLPAAEKYSMTVDEVKEKKATIKLITSKYTERQEAAADDGGKEEATADEPEAGEAQEEPTVEEPSEAEEEAPKAGEADKTEDMVTDEPAGRCVNSCCTN